VEHFSDRSGFRALVQGNFAFQRQALHADACILDEIDFSAPLSSEKNICDIIRMIHRKGPGIFQRYIASQPENKNPQVPRNHGASKLTQSNLVDAFWILSTLNHIPDLLVLVLGGLFNADSDPLDHLELNIEALWSVLTPESAIRPQAEPKPPCERLFLAAFFLSTLELGTQGRWSLPGGQPKMYSIWTMAAIILFHQATCTFLTELSKWHISRLLVEEEQRFFMTKKGYFGRAPLPNHDKDCAVAIIGGAWVPYILEQHGNYYKLYSHAYVQGVMTWKRLPSSLLVQRIELR
jgi:hypothetical protein